MKNKNIKRHAGGLWITMGLLLIAAALFLSAYNFYDEQRAGQSAAQAAERLEQLMSERSSPEDLGQAAGEGEATLPDYMLFPQMEMPVLNVAGVDYIGVLLIPALELELPVISQWSYPNLQTAPCRYSGSAYLNNLILCAHNYSTHFGSLKDLQEGDSAIFTDVDGNVFAYRMALREVLNPTDIEEMESGDWDLTLFTCTLGGKTRVTVRFELEEA